jgi:hypothetical protein
VNTPAGKGFMRTDVGPTARVIAVFLLGCLVFGYPLLALFNVPATVVGVPVLYLYVFGAWAALILLIAWAVRRA